LQIALECSINELEQFAEVSLHEAPYTFDEILGILNVSADELTNLSIRGNLDRGTKKFLLLINRLNMNFIFLFN